MVRRVLCLLLLISTVATPLARGADRTTATVPIPAERLIADPGRLPGNSLLVKQRPAVWEQYKTWVAGLTLILLAQFVTIALLVLNRRRMKLAENQLRKSEYQFISMFNATTDALVIVDIERKVRSVNPAFCHISGYGAEEVLGHGTERFFADHVDYIELDKEFFLRAASKPGSYDLRLRRKDGSEFWSELLIVPIEDAHGRRTGCLEVHRDITERKSAEQQLRQAALVYQEASEAIMVADAGNRIVAVNPAFTALTGYGAAEAIGQSTNLLKSGLQDEVFYREMWHALNTTGRWQGEIQNRRKNGEIFSEWLMINTIHDKNNAVLRRVAICSDITERKRFQGMLLQRNTELHKLYASMQTVREEERRRFARELHDDLGQRVTALRIDLDWLEARLPPAESPISAKLATIHAEVDQIVDSIRRISEDLRPGMLDTLGLMAAIQNYAEKFTARTGIRCDLTMSHDDFDVDEKVAIGIFRVVQEALNNAFKHAEASSVSVSVLCADEEIVLVVEDDGIGLSDDFAEGANGFGLPGMRERISILNGRISIAGKPGRGVRIEAVIPT